MSHDPQKPAAPATAEAGSAGPPALPSADGNSIAPEAHWARWRRRTVRIFAVMVTLLIAIDTAPGTLQWLQPAKQTIAPWSRRSGLWQGEWPLFAPNPYINNAWLSAEVYDPERKLEMWNSEYWADHTAWEKFRRFRYMNYYNRLPYRHRAAAKDLSDYLARQLIAPTARPLPVPPSTDNAAGDGFAGSGSAATETAWELRLYHNQMNLSMPPDGTLPPREDTVWISSSVNLTRREYQP